MNYYQPIQSYLFRLKYTFCEMMLHYNRFTGTAILFAPPPFKLINTIVKLENFGMEKKVLLRNKKKRFGSDWLNRKSVVHMLTIRLRSAKQTYCEKNDLLKPLYHRFYIYNI